MRHVERYGPLQDRLVILGAQHHFGVPESGLVLVTLKPKSDLVGDPGGLGGRSVLVPFGENELGGCDVLDLRSHGATVLPANWNAYGRHEVSQAGAKINDGGFRHDRLLVDVGNNQSGMSTPRHLAELEFMLAVGVCKLARFDQERGPAMP